MPSSLVALVMQRLQVIHQTELPDGFPVTLGPPVGDIPSQYAAVGYGGDDRAGIVGQGEPAQWGNGMTSETFGIWCTLSAATGDNNPVAQMDTVDALFQPIARSIRNDPRMGGVVVAPGIAELGPYEWSVEPETTGTVVTVFYQVVVRGVILSG